MISEECIDNLSSNLSNLDISNDLSVTPTKTDNNDPFIEPIIKKKNYSHILYYTLKLENDKIHEILTNNNISIYKKDDNLEIFHPHIIDILQLKDEDKFVIHNKNIYKLNKDFHITLLYVGGKKESLPDENGKTNFDKCIELENFLHSNVQIILEKISISEKFIAIKVLSCDNIPYFGNPVIHITIGLKISKEKLKPADSPSVFDDMDRTDIFINEITLNGIVDKITKY